MAVMEECVPGLWQESAISAVIDLTELHGRLKLSTILDQLKISNGNYRGLHCGGNGANYSLRAVLLTATQHLKFDSEKASLFREENEKIGRLAQDCRLSSLRDDVKSERVQKRLHKDFGEPLDDMSLGWGNIIFEP